MRPLLNNILSPVVRHSQGIQYSQKSFILKISCYSSGPLNSSEIFHFVHCVLIAFFFSETLFYDIYFIYLFISFPDVMVCMLIGLDICEISLSSQALRNWLLQRKHKLEFCSTSIEKKNVLFPDMSKMFYRIFSVNSITIQRRYWNPWGYIADIPHLLVKFFFF